MTALRDAAKQALEALEIGYVVAKAEADHFHAAMAGYKPARHAAIDADVQGIARAITALRAALAQQAEPALTVETEPDYMTRGHFCEGTKPWVNPTKVWKLPVGTKLYLHPPAQSADVAAMRQALEALLRGRLQIVGVLVQQDQDDAIAALRAALGETR